MNDPEAIGWDAAVDTACKKVQAIQTGFRGLLKSARAEMLREKDRDVRADYERNVTEGEAVVGVLSDVIRNIAAMKGNMPR
jgi:hypothetical protein